MSTENAPKKKFRGVLRDESDKVENLAKNKVYVNSGTHQKPLYQRNTLGNSTSQSSYKENNSFRHKPLRNLESFQFSELDELAVGSQFNTIREDEINNLKVYFTKGSLINGSMEYKTIDPNAKFPVIKTFQDMGLAKSLLNSLIRRYPEGPTGIQCAAIPGIIQIHTDFIVRAPTGSGKTAAFLVPVINQIEFEKEACEENAIQQKNETLPSKKKERKNKVYAIVITSVRELAMQMTREAMELAKDTDVKVAYAIGKVDFTQTLDAINQGCDIVVGTFGRLEQFIFKDNILNIDDLMYVVVDEADSLERAEGFRNFFHRLKDYKGNKNFQAILSSATLTFESELNLYNPTHIYVSDDMPPPTIVHRIINVAENPGNKKHPKGLMPTKTDFLLAFLELKVIKVDPDGSKRIPKMIIYIGKKRKVDSVAIFLLLRKFRVYPFHGDKTMETRNKAIDKMKRGEIDAIIATNVLSRGINMKIDYVINYDLPVECTSYVEFVHRVGRVGRVGNFGIALSFYDPKIDYGFAPFLQKMLEFYRFEVPKFISDAASAYFKSHYEAAEQYLEQKRNKPVNSTTRIFRQSSILPPDLNIKFA